MKLTANIMDPPMGSLILVRLIKSRFPISVEWSDINNLQIEGVSFNTDASISRIVARSVPDLQFYGFDSYTTSEVNSWLTFADRFTLEPHNTDQIFNDLEKAVLPGTFLVGNAFTIADIFVWLKLRGNKDWLNYYASSDKTKYKNLIGWYSFIDSLESLQNSLQEIEKIKDEQQKNYIALMNSIAASNKSLPQKPPAFPQRNAEEAKRTRNSLKKKEDAQKKSTEKKEAKLLAGSSQRKEEGKFVDLPGAEMGKVVVRFPPEASGYLHIGHAKAALLNQYYRDAFNGELIMRFDDTNPAKEKVDFEKVILEDLELLQIKADRFSHTSDYFNLMIQYCEQLITHGQAYVDDTDPELMKQEREQRKESENRNNGVEKNRSMWNEMKAGSEYGQRCCVRAKIDMSSDNGCLRDPTIYRCKVELHPRTNDKYKVYPTYDFACPIVDSIEGVTHCLRTMEYHDRDEQFYWFINALNLRKPYIWEYSRLNMTNTVLSKRKLTWFVEEGIVDGWDDARFPTVRGIIRRGMTVEALKQFIVAQGSSRSVVIMEWDKIWSINKKVIDPIAPRYTAIDASNKVPVILRGVRKEAVKVSKHPKNADIGEKTIWISSKVYIDLIDAELLKEGENVTFINWGNIKITQINREGSFITSVEAEPNLENKDYKKTLKTTWLAECEESPLVPLICVYFDHIITKAVLGKDEDFKNFINPSTKIERQMLGDTDMRNLKKSEIIQLQRKGFYICDSPYRPNSVYTSKESPVILIYIPDGHTKDSPVTASLKKEAVSQETSEKKPKPSEIIETQEEEEKSVHNVFKDPVILHNLVMTQGTKVRNLKKDGASKNFIDEAVKVLLKLKSEFKALTGVDWNPNIDFNTLLVNSPANAEVGELSEQIEFQGDKVREMKAKKVDKNIINNEITILLALKDKYESMAGNQWRKEGGTPPPKKQKEDKGGASSSKSADSEIANLADAIMDQEKNVSGLQAKVDYEALLLNNMKTKYKEISKNDWVSPDKETSRMVNRAETHRLAEEIINANKSLNVKPETDYSKLGLKEAHVLISSKQAYAIALEQAWKIDPALNLCCADLISSHREAGLANIRKNEKELKELRDCQNVRKTQENNDKKLNVDFDGVPKDVLFHPDLEKDKSDTNAEKKEQKIAKLKKSKPKTTETRGGSSSSGANKKQTRLGIESKKEQNFSDWYTEVITKSEMIEYYDVSGCYILYPWAYSIWEVLQAWFDSEIKKMGVKNCYFPLFVSKAALEKEKDHIADFAPEVAWVTKSGDTDLAEPVAIRPTSETVMYPAFARKIRSHRNLPLKLNQWNNVIRWEFKHPQPFLRTREFLWQEGHSAFATAEEAKDEVYTILDLYAKLYTDLLAVPVVKGRKTEKEKFAGGDFTTTVEAFIAATGRGIQGATSHHLGQNFSKMFEIVIQDPETNEKKYVYQNSWGFTTRTIGVMIMMHSDNKGLVLPPRIAPIQVILIPCGIGANTLEEEKISLIESCTSLQQALTEAGIRASGDLRDYLSPGWKFSDWELKGVPLRIEIGPRDVKLNQVVGVRRDTGEKLILKRDIIIDHVLSLLDTIHNDLYRKANNELNEHMVVVNNWDEFSTVLDQKNILLSPFCGDVDCEDRIKQDSARDDSSESTGGASMGAKSLCIPFSQPSGGLEENQQCIHPSCSNKALYYTLFGRSY